MWMGLESVIESDKLRSVVKTSPCSSWCDLSFLTTWLLGVKVDFPKARRPAQVQEEEKLFCLLMGGCQGSRRECVTRNIAVAFWEEIQIAHLGLSWRLNSKESSCQYGKCGFDPWVGKIPWRRKQQPTPVFLPGESHGQRSLMDYSPWGCKESDMT